MIVPLIAVKGIVWNTAMLVNEELNDIFWFTGESCAYLYEWCTGSQRLGWSSL